MIPVAMPSSQKVSIYDSADDWFCIVRYILPYACSCAPCTPLRSNRLASAALVC